MSPRQSAGVLEVQLQLWLPSALTLDHCGLLLTAVALDWVTPQESAALLVEPCLYCC
jgi:hypothetical protein